jgi:hypothetical protein
MLEMMKRALEPRNNRSWGPVWLFFFLGTVWFGHRAIVEKSTASRQQTSFGTIGFCGERGRGHDTYCSYLFPVGDDHYRGSSRGEREYGFGRTVEVYFDSKDPRVNSLEDFSKQSWLDTRLAGLFVLLFLITFVFVIWDRTPYATKK